MLKHVMILLCSILADPGEPPYAPNAWWKYWWRLFWLSALVVLTFVLCIGYATARDLGQWETSDPNVVRWYRDLKMPDAPTVSCCGESDAYWADTFEQKDGQYVAIITDDRPDEPLHRPHRDIGQRILIPNHKIKWNEGNPTSHGVLFIGASGGIYCYVPPGGV